MKHIDLNEFIDEGYLQEVNRQFFHPLGLALSINLDDDGNPIGFGEVWDYRDDPEGIIFGSLDNDKTREKAKKVEEQAKKLETTRIQKFGWRVQPIY